MSDTRRRPAPGVAYSALLAACALAISIVVTAGAANAQPLVGNAHPSAPAAGSERAVAAVEHVLNGIPESGDALGYPDAPVTLQVFGDLECPVCRELALGALPDLIAHDVRTHRLRIEAHALETATREPRTFARQQIAALAAGRQDRMWYFNEIFYREQGREDSGYVTNAFLGGIAQQVPGLELSGWSAARADPALAAQISEDGVIADVRRFTGTPSFLLGRTGRRLRPFQPGTLRRAAPFEAAIARLLQRRA